MAASGRRVVDDDQPVDVKVGRPRQPLRHRVRQRPVARAAAQRGSGLQGIGIDAGVELPRAESVEDRGDERLPGVGLGLGLLQQLVAAG